MPFFLYRLEEPWHIQVSEMPLLPILREIARFEVPNGRGPWHASAAGMLRVRNVPDAEKHSIIIDLKPKQKDSVSLYEIEDVWGFSSETWTPLALRLKPLFVDFECKNTRDLKLRFVMPSAGDIAELGGPIHEFLYAMHDGGVQGRWRWGRSGVVNAALLWPDALAYFFSSLRERMQPITGANSAVEEASAHTMWRG